MKIYSEVGRQRFGQVLGDLMLVGWIAGCIGLGYLVHEVTNLLGTPGRKAAEAGDGLAEDLRRLAEPAGQVPAVGDELRAPIDGAAGAATKLADAGRDQAHAVEQLALVVGTGSSSGSAAPRRAPRCVGEEATMEKHRGSFSALRCTHLDTADPRRTSGADHWCWPG